jgi:hypothetical protein
MRVLHRNQVFAIVAMVNMVIFTGLEAGKSLNWGCLVKKAGKLKAGARLLVGGHAKGHR